MLQFVSCHQAVVTVRLQYLGCVTPGVYSGLYQAPGSSHELEYVTFQPCPAAEKRGLSGKLVGNNGALDAI